MAPKTFQNPDLDCVEEMAEAERRCRFWLPKKRRFCANLPIPNSSFCGNHTARSDSQWIPCPIDPSHSVLQDNLESHVKRCPLLKQAQSLSLYPYFQKGINAGNDDEERVPPNLCRTALPSNYPSTSSDHASSEMKRNAVYSLTLPRFCALIDKIKTLHESISKEIRDSFRVPEACNKWIRREVDRKMPFQEKHVIQQASILGNLEDFGILRNPSNTDDSEVPAVVEFGAGRGYLTQLLADCYGIKRVFLVERKSYKLKADRSLRQKESLVLERLRIDIEDLNLNAVESLQGLPFLATGKHLCGPATDLTLRCCLGQHMAHSDASNSGIQGLAIATCCHHLCQWKHYINKRYLRNLGIGMEEFHALTWFTSWAVDADHGSNLPEISDPRILLPSE
ncbi:hypothetical protein SAY86_016028 [Trapa natans]|uniref:tRNA:m(4)X modification enzyme TRM13 n=1 Tax=Trapa natans TaxID=22666 RepID=A0AAN7LJK3_TRANT|nr:hypothetical protein SAY86_016028 [Trapa natans]